MDKTLACGFYRAVEKTPDKPAFVLDGLTTSFAQLAEQIVGLRSQHRILQDGRPEQALRIVLCLTNSAEVATWYLLCVTDGHTLVLTDPAWSAALLQQTLLDLQADLVVDETSVRPGRRGVSEKRVETIAQKLTPGRSDPQKAVLENPDPEKSLLGKQPFLIGFTSGSSGRPKAFIRNQQSWLESFANSRKEFVLTTDTTTLAPGPLSHGLSFYAMAESLGNGATFYSQALFDATKCQRLIDSGQISNLVAVPTMLHKLLSHTQSLPASGRPERSATGGSSASAALKRIVTAGAKLHTELRDATVRQFKDAVVSEYYGASELSFVSVSHAGNLHPDSVGRPFHGVEVAVLGSTGEQLPAGQVGQIHVRSRMLADGYLEKSGDIKALESKRAEQGWATVGDMGTIDSDGVLFLHERDDRMVTSGGFNIFPSAIEKILLQKDGVFAVAVAGCREQQWGHVIGALLQLEPGCSLGRHELLLHARQQLADYELPRRFFLVDELPLTSSGKIALAQVASILETAMHKDTGADSTGVIVAGGFKVTELQ